MDRISHRGPDGRGHAAQGDLLLGHVRLAIQDTSDAASQPFREGTTLLAYNGEAYNADALRDSVGGPWTTSSDTEPIARLLHQVGIPCLRRIDGMFALAWTGPQGSWLARDRYGKIPLYVAEVGDGYAFASEIKAFARGLRPWAVPPGTALHLETGRLFRWDEGEEPEDLEPQRVLELLRDGVRQRLVGDRPVCFLLSGGLDSSLVLALGKELHPEPVAYTAVYDAQSEDLASARRVAQALEVPLVEVPVPRPTPALIGEAVAAVEVPMKAQVEIALAHLPLTRAIAADGYRVALSGEAADELFCGYGNMMMAAGRAGDNAAAYRAVLAKAVDKMARGNFIRVNKVMMAAGVEGRLPFMEERLVASLLASTKDSNPPGKKLLKRAALPYLEERDLGYLVRRTKDTFQGGTGIAAAAAEVVDSPIRFYNAEARQLFGFLPKE